MNEVDNITEDLKVNFRQHLYELNVFSSSLDSYLTYLKNLEVCPYELYEKHIKHRWSEIIESWTRLKEDQEVLAINLSDSAPLLSEAGGPFTELYVFTQQISDDIAVSFEKCFRNLRILHSWISHLAHQLKYLKITPVTEWPQEWYCPDRHSVAHHSQYAVIFNHSSSSITDLSISASSRIRRKKQFQKDMLDKLNRISQQIFQKQLKEEMEYQQQQRDRYFEEYTLQKETSPITTSRIPFTVPSRSLVSSRFQAHNEYIARRKKIESLQGEFEYDTTPINLRKFLQHQFA